MHYRWQRTIILTLVMTMTLVFTTVSLAATPAADPATVKKSVVTVTTFDEAGKVVKTGSGFFTAVNQVVSNRQLLEGASRGEITASDGKSYPVAGIIAEDKTADLVLLQIDGQPGIAAVKTTFGIPQAGSAIQLIGGVEANPSQATIAHAYNFTAFGGIFIVKEEVTSTFNGSPAMDEKGRVFGVTTVRKVGEKIYSFIIPEERLKNLKPGNAVSLSQWNASQAQEWIASGNSLYFEGLMYMWVNEKDTDVLSQQCFEKAVALNPNHAWAWFYLGLTRQWDQKNDEAMDAYNQATKVQEDFPEAYVQIGWLYERKDEYALAAKSFQTAISQRPAYAEAHAGLAWVYNDQGKYTNATNEAKEALKLSPNLYTGHSALGYASFYLGRFSEAAKEFQIILAVNPDDIVSRFNLGVSCLRLKRFKEAKAAFEEVIRLQPNYADAHLILGITLVQMNDRKGAHKEYEILQSLDRAKSDQLLEWIKNY